MAENTKRLNRRQAMQEVGITGERSPMGFTHDEFIPQLRGDRAIKKYREMRENDPIIGAIMLAMEMLLRRTPWTFEPPDDSARAEAEKEFAESLLEDMSHTFSDFLAQVVSMLTFGFHFTETVYKRREGPGENPMTRSKFTDGRIGIRKLAPRAQWSLQRFDTDEKGGIQAFIQQPMWGQTGATIPIEKGLLFRTTTLNNSPLGRSVLRSAYIPYYYASHIDNIEAIAIERELNGLPMARVPSSVLKKENDGDAQFLSDLEQMLRDVKFNDQGFMILPSDLWQDDDGKYTSERLVDFSLVASEGTRAIDTGAAIKRHQQNMARTVLADFIMLGTDKGSFALSKSKTDLFLEAMQGYMDSIAEVLNRHLFTRVWALNGLPDDTRPTFKFGEVAPVDLTELGQFIRDIGGAGVMLTDEDTENALREAADLPERPDDPDMLGRPEPPVNTPPEL